MYAYVRVSLDELLDVSLVRWRSRDRRTAGSERWHPHGLRATPASGMQAVEVPASRSELQAGPEASPGIV